MIALPKPCHTFDQLLAFFFSNLAIEDFLIAQELLRDYETEAAQHWISLGRRQVIMEIRCVDSN